MLSAKRYVAHKFTNDFIPLFTQVCVEALQNAVPMGGPGCIVQIDESYISGRRKYNRGRLLAGNRVPPPRNNYGNRQLGPWVLGMVMKHPNGRIEKRFFAVLRRDEATLRAKVHTMQLCKILCS